MRSRVPTRVTAVAAAAVLTGLAACSSDGGSEAEDSSKKKQSEQSADTGEAAGDDNVRTSGAKCNLKSYPPGDAISDVRKGAGTPKYNDGFTKKRGRTLHVRTGQTNDRSGATLTGTKTGDKLWLTISHSNGKYWQSCGHRTADRKSMIKTRWYLHSNEKITNRWIRACAKTDGKVWCADIGDKKNRKNPDGKLRHWWTDD